MSSSASEVKARQRRIKNVTRQVIHKAYFQRIKDELRAEERRKVREERQREEERLINRRGGKERDRGYTKRRGKTQGRIQR
jgi:hypothetical protein